MSLHEETSIAKSAVLVVAMRWTDRLIGIASTLILARLLVPDDFGVVAQASLVVGLLTVFTDLGVHIALIQNASADKSHFDTAWTIRLLQYGFIALMVIVFAPAAGDYFGDPRVVPVLQVMTLNLLLMGGENIGIVTFQKEMKFGLDFRFLFLKRLAGFIATIVLAVIWQSYWAMVAGTLVTTGIGVLLSYTMHPMRPSFSLEKFKEVFSVSQWALVRSIGEYLEKNLDRFLIGGRADAAVVGGYTVANDISLMPSSEVLAPLNRVLFPAFVRVKENAEELKRVFLMAQGVQTLIAIPASVGLSLVAEEAVHVLLGAKWLFAVPFVQLLALIYVVQAISTSAGYVMITLGHIRANSLIFWSQVLLFAILAILAFPQAGAEDIAGLRLLSSLAGLLMTFGLLKRILSVVTLGDVSRTVYRPLLAAGAMAIALTQLSAQFDINPAVMLFAKIGVGAVVYLSVIAAAWWAAGKPQGAETYLLSHLSGITGRFRNRS